MAQEPNPIAGDPVPDAHRSTEKATSSATPTEIRAQIEHTRADMSETIDAIQARLSPSRVVADAKETVKDATVGRVKRLARGAGGAFGYGSVRAFESGRVINTVKANPIAVALIGSAVTAIVVRTVSRSRNRIAVHRERDTEGRPHVSRSTWSPLSRRRKSLLVGACAGLACWSVWRVQHASARVPGQATSPYGPDPVPR